MTDDQLYDELHNVITDIINEFVKGGGDTDDARRVVFDVARHVDFGMRVKNKPSAKPINLS